MIAAVNFLQLPPVIGAPPAFTPEGLAAVFKQMDKNGDGKLSGDELGTQPWIKRLDSNNDGAVTLDEAQKVLAFFLNPQTDLPAPTAVPPPAFVLDDSSPRQEPKQLKAGEHGIGAMLPDVSFTDLEGKKWQLSEFQAGKPLAIALISSSCPVSKRYVPTLARLEKEYRAKGVLFLLVAPAATDTPAELQAILKEHAFSAPCALDPTGALASTLGALSSTDTFVVDAARTLIYRGAIDDQYGLGYSLDAPRRNYLSAALDAVLAGGVPAINATEAPGCLLDVSKAVAAITPTYHNRISRLLQSNCLECHHAGGVAPFALETVEQVNAKANMIKKMVGRGLMPPWFAAPAAHSPWLNDRSLVERDKADLLAWLEGGRPVGDAKDAPIVRQWPAEWQIGAPDLVLQIPKPIAVKATGTMSYQITAVDTGLTEDRWIRGFEVKPTAREVVHHILIFAQDKASNGRGLDAIGGFFAAYVPGNSSVIYPDGFAKPLPANSRLVFQIHYTPNGTATEDQSRIGLLFAKEPPKHLIHVAGIAAPRLTIPAGEENHAETGLIPVPRDVKVLGFMPHMHVRGKAFRYEAVLPNGELRTLLDVPRYDFNWQLAYRFAEPPTIPAGSKVRAIGWFDNSANNPANPDPTKIVHWGLQTTEEMMLGYVEFFFPDGDDIPAATATR
ncbi:MAG: Redoxin domain protein [Chthoniobacteraceae bacterium]|nr:Redoxin domain protein [Chthoniobacteraceae bacterium]